MKKNNNKTLIFAIFAIVLTIIALIATSGTYAKYTSSATTTKSSASVAKWSVKIDGEEIATAEPKILTLDLFSEIQDTKDSLDETDVADNKIAPGTCGELTFEIANESEVNIECSLELSETEATKAKNIPIKYSLTKNGTYCSAEEFNSLAGSKTSIAMNGSENVTIYWKWDFALDDTADTALGIAAQSTTEDLIPKYEVTAKIVATQVD